MLSPVVFDVILAGIAAEFGVLAWLLRRVGRGRWIPPVFWFLLSGALLMLAVRGALAEAELAAIAIPLIVSLLTHVACLWTAWRAALLTNPSG